MFTFIIELKGFWPLGNRSIFIGGFWFLLEDFFELYLHGEIFDF